MIKQETVNTFHDGMIMDLNPLVTPNNVVTNALNATLVTMNGNENVLQNDMGNGRIETAYLPEGYVPLGTAQLGGIIYIVSYNPLSKKCQIGSFPSPERNITSDKFIGSPDKTINCLDFYLKEKDDVDGYRLISVDGYGFISNPYQKLILTNQITLHPGDKFQIYSPQISKAADYISAFNQSDHNPDHNPDLLPKYLKFNIMAITDDGKMTNLNNTLVWQPLTEGDQYKGDYYIRNNEVDEGNYKNIDEYRNLVQSNYNVFQTKTSGKLGIVAELECISSFDVSWDALKEENTWKIYLYTNWTYNNDYSKNQINLFGIYYKSSRYKEEKVIKITNYPTSEGESDTDIKNKNEVTFYNPPYISNIEEYLNGNKDEPTEPPEPRNNDGTDNQFLISTPITVPSTSDKGAILDLSIMPLMPFGILQWMEQNISINLSKLGTGSVDLVQYKYYVEDELVQLSWGLEAYPERNKSINNVTFNFYEINSDILTSIQSSGQKIDNNRLCNNKWQEYDETEQDWVNIEGTDLSLGSPVKSIINEGQSSYSGFFTENFNKRDLIENYVYLVEISIDYNKEKTIKYYRIFYNSNIFNDYYYKDNYNDFKEIVLDDEVQNQIQFTFVKRDTQIDENSTEFEGKVPSVSDESSTEFQKYNILHKYQGRDNGRLFIRVNDTFGIRVSGISISKQTHTLTNNAQAERISSSSIPSSVSVDKITYDESNEANISVNNALITTNFNYNIKIPLQMTYNTKLQLNNSYELVHATCTYCWMIYRGRDKYHHLNLYPNITNIGEDDYYIARDSFSDDKDKTGTIRTYINCYSQLSQLLDKYDIVALPTMAVRGTGGQGGRAVSIGFSLSSANNWNINSTTETSWSETLQNNFCGLFYAMKTQDDYVIVFSFDGKKGPAYFPNVDLSSGFECLRARSKDICKITDQKSYNDDEIPEYIFPLRGYYIPREYTGPVSKYQWTTLEYYPSFLETSSHNIEGTSEIKLVINSEIILDSNIAVNNLKYINKKKFAVSYESSWEVPTSTLISTLTDFGSDVYVKLPDGTLSKNITIGKNNVYDYKGKKISSIANWSNSTKIPVISEVKGSPNTMTLCVVDGRLRIKQNLLSSRDIGIIAGKSEEQDLKIQQIPIIPYAT